MEWPWKFSIVDALFKVHASCKDFCCNVMYRPVRIHIKYSKCPHACADLEALHDEIRKYFGPLDVKISSERAPTAFGFVDLFEIWIVGGKLLYSKRNGEGWLDSDEKREKIIEELRLVVEKAVPPDWMKCYGDTYGGMCGDQQGGGGAAPPPPRPAPAPAPAPEPVPEPVVTDDEAIAT